MLDAVERCRACGGRELTPLLSLGEQALTGIFPRDPAEEVFRAPLELVKCTGPRACGLAQLRHTCDLTVLYGRHYGYRSSLNASMVRHLRAKVERIRERVPLERGDLVLDIGSNDGT